MSSYYDCDSISRESVWDVFNPPARKDWLYIPTVFTKDGKQLMASCYPVTSSIKQAGENVKDFLQKLDELGIEYN